jgi:hypothetical protein
MREREREREREIRKYSGTTNYLPKKVEFFSRFLQIIWIEFFSFLMDFVSFGTNV